MTPPRQAPAAPASWALAIRKFLRRSIIAFAIALPVGALIGYLFAGWPGVWGVVLGLAIPMVFFGISVVCAAAAAKWSPNALAAIVLGSYILKVALLILFLAAISGKTFYSKPAFGVTLLLGTLTYLVGETWTLLQARIPYVEPTKAD